MRLLFCIGLAIVLWASYCVYAGDGGTTNRPPLEQVGTIHFDDSQQIDAQGILQIYMAMSGRQLVIDSRAAQIHTTIKSHVKIEQRFTHDEALKLIEKNLLEEAAIIITPIDGKRVSVTYNDALPTKN
jgi:hypothetical protein